MKKIEKSEQQWRAQLGDEQFRICRQKGTERAFTGKYWNHKEPGIYHCACCDLALFSSEAKFDSGSGWPSFTQPLEETSVIHHSDTTLPRERTEILCAQCDAHLGHVFDDGPKPTGMRYCINSAALKHKPSE